MYVIVFPRLLISYVDESVQDLSPLSICFESSITALEILLSESNSELTVICIIVRNQTR